MEAKKPPLSYNGIVDHLLTPIASNSPEKVRTEEMGWGENRLPVPKSDFTDEEVQLMDELWEVANL